MKIETEQGMPFLQMTKSANLKQVVNFIIPLKLHWNFNCFSPGMHFDINDLAMKCFKY